VGIEADEGFAEGRKNIVRNRFRAAADFAEASATNRWGEAVGGFFLFFFFSSLSFSGSGMIIPLPERAGGEALEARFWEGDGMSAHLFLEFVHGESWPSRTTKIVPVSTILSYSSRDAGPGRVLKLFGASFVGEAEGSMPGLS